MSSHSIRLADLAKLPREDRERRLNALARDAMAPRNGQAHELQSRISAFESRFKLTSADMLASLRSGDLKETEEIASWAMLLRVSKRAPR